MPGASAKTGARMLSTLGRAQGHVTGLFDEPSGAAGSAFSPGFSARSGLRQPPDKSLWQRGVELGLLLVLSLFFSFALMSLFIRLFVAADVQNQLCDSVDLVAMLTIFIVFLWIQWDNYVKRRAEAAEAVLDTQGKCGTVTPWLAWLLFCI
jgi:hypothetical protein